MGADGGLSKPCLSAVFHHVWELPTETLAREYWLSVMMSRTEEGNALPCVRLHGDKGIVPSTDASIVLAATQSLMGGAIEIHNRNYLFRVGETCCKIYLGVFAPRDQNDQAAIADMCMPIIRRAVHRIRRGL